MKLELEFSVVIKLLVLVIAESLIIYNNITEIAPAQSVYIK